MVEGYPTAGEVGRKVRELGLEKDCPIFVAVDDVLNARCSPQEALDRIARGKPGEETFD